QEQRPPRRHRPGQGLARHPPRRGRPRARPLIFDLATFVISLVVALVLHPPAISTLRRLKAGQVIQEELPDSHQKKAGTPTGGGIVFVALAVLGGLPRTIR